MHVKQTEVTEYDKEPLNYLVVKGSSEIASDKLWKTKINCSYSTLFSDTSSLYVNLTAGYLRNLGGEAKQTKVNDAFYLPNFKGIKNVGYYFDTEGKREGLCGDTLGFDRYI